MKVLVAYATRHGSTAGIADRLAERIIVNGIMADARPVSEGNDIAPYDAVVLGSAAYMGRWLPEATVFAKQHQSILQTKHVWLFSSGPLGHNLADKRGQDVLETSRPKDFGELHGILAPRGDRVFFGSWDPESKPIGVGERLFRLAPGSRKALPAGDLRNWEAIDAWADGIASELRSNIERNVQ